MMEFDGEVTSRILGYLRQHGEMDPNGFGYDWKEEGPVVTRWDFTNIPRPTLAQLEAVPQQLVDFFAHHEREVDIFTGRVEGNKAEIWRPVPLTPARYPNACAQETEGSDKLNLPGGFWKLGLFGDSSSGAVLRIVSLGGEVFAERSILSGNFDVARTLYFPASTSIKLVARHVKSTSSPRDNFKLEISLLAEKL